MVQSISQIGRMASKWIDGFLSCRERKCDFSYLTAAAICEASTSDAIGSGSWHGNAGSPCLHIQLLLCHLQLPMAAREDTLELLFASSPPSVTAAVMKECVLDEYSTKHRISINRFLQLKIFVKIAILDSVNMGGGRDILRKERSSKAWLKNSIHPWYLRYIMFQPLKESCIHSGDSNFLDLEWLST
uniref:Uncharacterized protein n=1 Tax=Oryza nivara TaxID=4536 RepID=A0A0E0IWD4_ORYNI